MWLHETKHAGDRILARKRVTVSGYGLATAGIGAATSSRVAEALQAVEADELVIDGEACAHCPDGLPDFHGLRSEDGNANACQIALG